jgi:SAM-dependent methyltransferase
MPPSDEEFDRLYPSRIRRHSALHWTAADVATTAAKLLVTKPGTKVLDIGCGPGKFCLVGATETQGHFTGIEQRRELVAAARRAVLRLGLTNVTILRGNILDFSFEPYEAFYLYNPFEENLSASQRIDATIPLSPAHFKKYAQYVAAELGKKPFGTRVVTYAGYADEIPDCYDCESTFFDDDLKLWIKRRDYDPALTQLSLRSSRSYRGSAGWEPPRQLG